MQQSGSLATTDAILHAGIIPLFYHADVEVAKRAVKAAYEGGAAVFEFTNRGSNALKIFHELVSFTKDFDGFRLGIGTIMNADSAKEFIQAGARFVISPIVRTEVGEICAEDNLPWIPGCATPTEIVTAIDGGAEIVKIFPGSVLGPDFVKSMKQVMPTLKMMVTGGVAPTEQSIGTWLRAGASVVGIGSQLFPPDLVKAGKWDELTTVISETVSLVKKLKGGTA